MVRGKPRTFLHSAYNRKALESCSVAAQTYSLYSSLAQKICTLQKSRGMHSRPDLRGDPKHMAPSLCLSLSPLLAPHWHCLLTLHFTTRMGNWKEQRRPCWCFQICKKLPGGGKTVCKGLVSPMLTFPGTSGEGIHTPQMKLLSSLPWDVPQFK